MLMHQTMLFPRDQIVLRLRHSKNSHLPVEKITNVVKDIYKPFTAEQISDKIAELLTPSGIQTPVSIVYQSIEGLHAACPQNLGDWYFTGNYPTPGGNRVVNQSFVNYMEGKNVRAY